MKLGYIHTLERVRLLRLRYDAILRELLRVDPGSWSDDLGSQVVAAIDACDLGSVKRILGHDLCDLPRDEVRSLARRYDINPRGLTKSQMIEEIKNARNAKIKRQAGKGDTGGNGQTVAPNRTMSASGGILLCTGIDGERTETIPGGSYELDPNHSVDDVRRLENDPEAAI